MYVMLDPGLIRGATGKRWGDNNLLFSKIFPIMSTFWWGGTCILAAPLGSTNDMISNDVLLLVVSPTTEN